MNFIRCYYTPVKIKTKKSAVKRSSCNGVVSDYLTTTLRTSLRLPSCTVTI